MKSEGLPALNMMTLWGMAMSDEQIAHMTVSEIAELIKRLADELEIRAMQKVD